MGVTVLVGTGQYKLIRFPISSTSHILPYIADTSVTCIIMFLGSMF